MLPCPRAALPSAAMHWMYFCRAGAVRPGLSTRLLLKSGACRQFDELCNMQSPPSSPRLGGPATWREILAAEQAHGQRGVGEQGNTLGMAALCQPRVKAAAQQAVGVLQRRHARQAAVAGGCARRRQGQGGRVVRRSGEQGGRGA